MLNCLFKTLFVCLLVVACGGGSGIGPNEIFEQEANLRDRLPTDWAHYQNAEYATAIEFFTETLENASTFDGSESILNEIKSEAHNGIGWAFFRLQDLDAASSAFQQATKLNRRNQDAWAGHAGVALARGKYNDAAQYALQNLSINMDYNSGLRADAQNRILGHDNFDSRHVRLILAESYFQLGRYSAQDRPDPNNAAAQLRLIKGDFTFVDAGQLLNELGKMSLNLTGLSGQI